MGEVLFEARNLSRCYGLEGSPVHALRGIDFRIDQGELIAVTGPSGSGKSTLLSLLGLLARPSSGCLEFRGQDVAGLSGVRRAQIRNVEIGFVFQSFQLLERTTVIENVELPLFYNNVGSSRRHEMAMAVLREVGLDDRANQFAHQLSGGEQQRVAIARAIVNQPGVILADEPTGALDTRTGAEIIALLHQLHHRGSTVIIITHNMDIASAIERRLELIDGRLRSTPDSAEESLFMGRNAG